MEKRTGKIKQDRVMTAMVQLILAPDCGRLPLSRAAVKQKLVNLASATGELNREGA